MVEEFQRAFKADDTKSKKWTFGKIMKTVKGKILQTPTSEQLSSPQLMDRANTVMFEITGFSKSSVEKVIRELDKRFDENISEYELKTVLKKIGGETMAQIQKITNHSYLELQYDQKKKILKVSGFQENVHEASNKIHEILRDAEVQEERKNSAEFMSNLVKWCYIEITLTGQSLQEYDKDVNYNIEKAYSSRESEVSYMYDGIMYTVDFHNMIEYKKTDPSDQVTVIRKELMKEFKDGTFNLPAEWATLQGGNLRVCCLKETEPEYKNIEKSFMDSSGGSFRVTGIQRVQNKTLFLQYQAKKKLLEEQKPKVKREMFLWHGTSQDVVDNINAHGFNRSYCGKNAKKFGDGVYFAVSASYSCRDTYSKATDGVKNVYYCRVLTGEHTQGKEEMRVPPHKSGASKTEMYDSVVDRMDKPNMFVIFHDTQAYPDYLISFKKS